MTLIELTRIANNYADEEFDEEVVRDFVNEALARINIALDVSLPMLTGAEYTALTEAWQRTLLIPYIHYSIKINDGSMNEASYAIGQRFETAMRELKRSRSFDIKKEYRLRWVPITEDQYNLAIHKGTITKGNNIYAVDPELLPALGGALDTGVVNFQDMAIKVIFTANGTNEYYQLKDVRQQAQTIGNRRSSTNDGWWF